MGKRYGCRCEGHWQRRRRKWRVIERVMTRPLLVKCMTCNQSWRSKAKHAHKLLDHKVKKYYGANKLTYHEILLLILEKKLLVNLKTAKVFSINKRYPHNPGGHRSKREAWVELKQTPDKKRGYLFVDVYSLGRRARVPVHKLVYMKKTGQIVPDGYHVDHRDRIVTHNWGSNLRLLTVSDNCGHRCNYETSDKDF